MMSGAGGVAKVGSTEYERVVVAAGNYGLMVRDNGVSLWDYSQNRDVHRVNWDW